MLKQVQHDVIMNNYFDAYYWQTMLSQHPARQYDISEYFNILCPQDDWPHFLDRYLELPVLKRLAGVGLLCGTDWTPLYKNRFYYSRLDHSLGVALIVWHFTHDKAQTIAGLLHDISTPVFSHVSDFRKGDALTQTATEEPTARIIRGDEALGRLLAEDGLTAAQVEDYHIYPIADNEIPQLSADRLEYMFPSGMALDGSWTMDEIRRCYNDLVILKNEEGQDELGFQHVEIAELYCEHFCMIGHILQLNENKLALHMLGQIMNLAEKEGILNEEDFMTLSEKEVIHKLESSLSLSGLTLRRLQSKLVQQSAQTQSSEDSRIKSGNDIKLLSRMYNTFRTMTSIEHTDKPLDEKEYFCVSLKVKQRYINPLVSLSGLTRQSAQTQSSEDSRIKSGNDNYRLSEISEKARRIIGDFKTYSDTTYGCAKLV